MRAALSGETMRAAMLNGVELVAGGPRSVADDGGRARGRSSARGGPAYHNSMFLLAPDGVIRARSPLGAGAALAVRIRSG